MSFFGLFGPPNVEKLRKQRNVNGLVKALSYTKDSEIRLAAAQALGETKNHHAVPPLSEALHDEDAEVQIAAAESLGKLGLSAVVPLLDILDNIDGKLKVTVIDSLGFIGDKRAVSKLLPFMQQKDLEFSTGLALEKINDPETYDVLSAFWVKNRRVEKCIVAGEIALPHIEAYLPHARSYELKNIIATVAKIEGNESAVILSNIVETKDYFDAKAALEALGSIKGAASTRAIIKALHATHPSIIALAANLLDNRGWRPKGANGAAFWTAQSFFSDNESERAKGRATLKTWDWKPNQTMAATAYWIVNEAWDKVPNSGITAAPVLLMCLQDSNQTVVERASDLLVNVGKPVVPFLSQALKDYFYWGYNDAHGITLLINVSNVLGRIGDPDAVENLIDVFSNIKKTTRHHDAAVTALAAIGAPAVPALIESLSDKTMSIVANAAKALGHIGDKRAVSPLIPVLKVHYPYVRTAVQKALQTITGQAFGQDVDQWQSWLQSENPDQ